MIRIINNFRNASIKTQAIISSVSLALYFFTSYLLETSYLKSKFPVPYFTQQTSFDAVKMKEWYEFMIQENTFQIYLKTQWIDFAFILAVISSGFTIWTLVSKLHNEKSWFRKYGYFFAFSLPLAGFFDILENIVSFFMIANPLEFSNALIIPYSTFASIKFGFWAVALIWLMISIIRLIITKTFVKKAFVVCSLFILGLNTVNAQEKKSNEIDNGLIYFEADPFAYINKGYSLHLGYENWGFRFDLTKVKVDFPESFEKAFYDTKAFDLVTNINGIKIDYIGKRTNWTKGAFAGLDVNAQRLSLKHRQTNNQTTLNVFNIGVRAGYKFTIYKGLYVTPWAAIWRNVTSEQSYKIGNDIIKTNEWDWITTIHIGYALKL